MPRKKFGRNRKNRCRFCTHEGCPRPAYVDYKDVGLLKKLCTNQNKMFSRKRSGSCAGLPARLQRRRQARGSWPCSPTSASSPDGRRTGFFRAACWNAPSGGLRSPSRTEKRALQQSPSGGLLECRYFVPTSRRGLATTVANISGACNRLAIRGSEGDLTADFLGASPFRLDPSHPASCAGRLGGWSIRLCRRRPRCAHTLADRSLRLFRLPIGHRADGSTCRGS